MMNGSDDVLYPLALFLHQALDALQIQIRDILRFYSDEEVDLVGVLFLEAVGFVQEGEVRGVQVVGCQV